MKKINLKGLSEVLSEKEMKNVIAGSGSDCSKNACGGSKPACCDPQWNWCVNGYCKSR